MLYLLHTGGEGSCGEWSIAALLEGPDGIDIEKLWKEKDEFLYAENEWSADKHYEWMQKRDSRQQEFYNRYGEDIEKHERDWWAAKIKWLEVEHGLKRVQGVKEIQL